MRCDVSDHVQQLLRWLGSALLHLCGPLPGRGLPAALPLGQRGQGRSSAERCRLAPGDFSSHCLASPHGGVAVIQLVPPADATDLEGRRCCPGSGGAQLPVSSGRHDAVLPADHAVAQTEPLRPGGRAAESQAAAAAAAAHIHRLLRALPDRHVPAGRPGAGGLRLGPQPQRPVPGHGRHDDPEQHSGSHHLLFN